MSQCGRSASASFVIRLAVAGTALAWVALLALLANPLWVMIQRQFFVLGFVAAVLVCAAALLAGRWRALAAAALAVTALAVVMQQALSREAAWMLVLVSWSPVPLFVVVAAFHLALMAAGACGLLIVRRSATPARTA